MNFIFSNHSKIKFISSHRRVISSMYVLLTGHITISPILSKNQSKRTEPKDMVLVFDVITSKLLLSESIGK